jgi:hypothetical protein
MPKLLAATSWMVWRPVSAVADRPHRPVPDPWKRFRDTCRRNAVRSRHAGAARKGPLHQLRHGRSQKSSASVSSGTWLDSTRYRPITRSPAAISNGKSFPCWNRKGSACSYGVRLPAACCPASTAGRTGGPRIRGASTTTFRSWTKSGPGRSSTCWLRSREHMVVVPRDSRSPMGRGDGRKDPADRLMPPQAAGMSCYSLA